MSFRPSIMDSHQLIALKKINAFQAVGQRSLFEFLNSDFVRAAIGGAGMVGVVNVGYMLYKDRRLERQQSRQTAVDKIVSFLSQPYKAPPMGLNLPFLSRPGLDELRTRLNMEEVWSINILEGPSKSGKSTTIQQLIDGRPHTVYLSVREKSEEIPILVAETFGAIGDKKENLKDLALGTVTGLIKSALIQISKKRQSTPSEQKHLCPVPICVIDDIQSQIQGDDFPPRIKALLFWLLEMANHSLLKVFLLTSDRRVITILENLSGFSQRLDVVPFSYINPTDLQKELAKHFNFSKSEAALIVKALGGHLGHVQDFLQTMKIANGKLTVSEAVEAVIHKADDKLLQALIGESRGDIDLATWLKVTHGIFIALAQGEQRKGVRSTLSNHTQVITTSDISEQLDIPLIQVQAVARRLANQSLLRYIDPVTYGYHCPMHYLAYTYLVVNEKAVQLQYWQTLKTKLSVTVSTVQNADTTDKSIVSKEQSQKPQIQSQQSTVEMLQEETMRSINVAEQGTTLSSDLTQHQQIQP